MLPSQHNLTSTPDPQHRAEEEHHHGPRVFNTAVFPFACLFVSLVFDRFSSWIETLTKKRIKIPQTVLLLIVSMVGTIFMYLTTRDHEMEVWILQYTWVGLSPHEIMFAVLPILIFEAAFKIEADEFMKNLGLILTLSVGCFLVSAVVTGGLVYVVNRISQNLDSWNIIVCLLFGSLISATDPVAVTALLHELGAPHDLGLLIEGESLLNDGAAIVAYGILIQIFQYDKVPDSSTPELIKSISLIVTYVALSIFIGILMAKVAIWALSRVIQQSTQERAIVFSSVYFTYIGCEYMGGSGVLGLVFLAIQLNRHKGSLSAEAAKDNLSQWEFLAYWANGIVFIITGLICGELTWTQFYGDDKEKINKIAYAEMFAVYAVVLIARLIVLVPLFWIFPRKPFKYAIKFEYILVMWWGGLRGAVALLLAIMFKREKNIDNSVGDRCMIYVGGIVVMSLIIQATSSARLIHGLELDIVNRYRQKIMDKIVQSLHKRANNAAVLIRQNAPELAEANWSAFTELVKINNPYEDTKAKHKSQTTVESETDSDDLKPIQKDTAEETDPLQKKHSVDVQLRGEIDHRVSNMMEAQLRSYNQSGALTENALTLLLSNLRETHDISHFNVQRCKSQWMVHNCWIRLNKRFQDRFHKTKDAYEGQTWIRILIPSFTMSEKGLNFQIILGFLMFAFHVVIYSLEYNHMFTSSHHLINIESIRIYEIVKALISIICILDYTLRLRFGIKYLWKMAPFWLCFDLVCGLLYIVNVGGRIDSVRECGFTDDFKTNTIEGWEWSRCKLWMHYELSLVVRILTIFPVCITFYNFITDQIKTHVYFKITTILTSFNGLCMAIEVLNKSLSNDEFFNSKEIYKAYVAGIMTRNKQIQREAQLEMSRLQCQFPRIGVSTKTAIGAMMFLHELQRHLETLEEHGELESSERDLLRRSINARMFDISQDVEKRVPELDLITSLLYHPCFLHNAQKFIDICKPKKLDLNEGDYLIRQGDEGNKLYYLLRGTVMFVKLGDDKKVIVDAVVHPGQLIGEVGFIFNEKRTGDIKAISSCVAYEFSREGVTDALNQIPHLEMKFVKFYCIYRTTDFLRKLKEFQAWTDLRLANLLNHSKVIDLMSMDKETSIEENSYSRILLIRGKIIDDRNQLIDATAHIQEVKSVCFKNAEIDKHCLILIIPREDLIREIAIDVDDKKTTKHHSKLPKVKKIQKPKFSKESSTGGKGTNNLPKHKWIQDSQKDSQGTRTASSKK